MRASITIPASTLTGSVGPWLTETRTPPNPSSAAHPYMSRTARRCEWPSSSSRWWMWALSALNGERPARVRRHDGEQQVDEGHCEHEQRHEDGHQQGSDSDSPALP